MKTGIFEINNQSGSVMALALMVIVTLTIVGMFALHDTVVEGTITRNQAIAKHNFYRAEAAAKMLAADMEAMTDKVNDLPPAASQDEDPEWMMNPQYSDEDISYTQAVSDEEFTDCSTIHTGTIIDDAGAYARYEGFAPGDNLAMGEATTLYRYFVYGWGRARTPGDNSSALVRLEYRLRY